MTPRDNPPGQHALRDAWLVLAFTLLVRAIIAARYPLLPDETYFWEWSRRLAAGYYDHPPGIAWVIAFGTSLLGDTPLGVRLGSLVCNAIAAGALIVAARDVGGAVRARRAALVFALLPLTSGMILATPDAPLAAAVSVTLLAALRALRSEAGSPALVWWLAAGLASGLAMATKLNGILAPFGIAVACIGIPHFRPVLRTPGPFLATALAAALMMPVLSWNAAHDWIAFRFQLTQGYGDGASGALVAAYRLLEFIGGQLLVTAVLPGIAMAMAASRAITGRLGATPQLPAVVAAVVFVPFVASALRQHGEPNWTAVAYPALILLLATADREIVSARRFRLGMSIAAVLVALGYLRALGALPLAAPLARHDPLADARGWATLAHTTDSVAAAQRRDGRTVFVAADRYQDASQLAFHMPGRPVTFSLNLAGRSNQYDIWPPFRDVARIGDDLVLVVDEVRTVSPPMTVVIVADSSPMRHRAVAVLTAHFTDAVRGPLASDVGDPDTGERRVWILSGWRGTWPVVR